MLRNIFLPVILILITSLATIYLWFENAPLSFFGVIGFFTLGIGCMYISYYIFFKLFPDKRNIFLPRINNLISYLIEQKNKPQYTVGSILGSLFAIILVGLGIFSWIKLADKYKAYQLNNFGQDTRSVIINKGYSKGIGTYREYEYLDHKGIIHLDKFANEDLSVGDTIEVRYSIKRPIINQVILPKDDD